MFKGLYNGSKSQSHPEDLDKVLGRAFSAGVKKLIVTGVYLLAVTFQEELSMNARKLNNYA